MGKPIFAITFKSFSGNRLPTVWLTAREQQLLKLIVEGYTNKEIAEKLFLSIETIKTYRKNLILKPGAKNVATLVKMAIEQKLV